jgi:excisionase family DNA binding protein
MPSHTPAAPRLLTVDEVATYLGMTPYAVRDRVKQRQIPFVRIGERSIRFDRKKIDAWIDAQAVEAVG